MADMSGIPPDERANRSPALLVPGTLRFGVYFFFWAAASIIACTRSMVG